MQSSIPSKSSPPPWRKGYSPSSSAAPLTSSNGCAIFPRARAYPERIVWCPLSPAIIAGACLCLWHSRARREKMNPTGGDHLSVSQPKPLVAQPG